MNRAIPFLAATLLLSSTACAQTPATPRAPGGAPPAPPPAAKGIDTPAAADQVTAIVGGLVHTMQKSPDGGWRPPIADGVVLIAGGKITAVGPRAQVEIPAGARVIEAPVVTPGLIDARSVVGLAGWLNYDHDQDQLERSEAMQPELRAIDAYDGREPLIAWIRGFGVTTIHTGHAPGQLVSGQTMIAKTRTGEVDDAVVNPFFAVAATLGDDALAGGGKSPGTRAKQLSMLRQALLDAREHAAKRERAAGDPEKLPGPDLRKDTWVRVLAGEIPLLVTCHRSVDIQNALRLAREFGFRLILDGAAEAYEHIAAIREAGVPVILHPPMYRASGEAENASMTTAAKLVSAGIPCALESGYESYVPKTRVVLYEAAIACAYGCPFPDALGLITRSAAEILGIGDRVGSLEPGKDGDVALYDGDPFEYTSHCVGVLIEGEVVSAEAR